MLFAILCYNEEDFVGSWTKEEDDACMARLAEVEAGLAAAGRLGPVMRLQPTRTAATLRKAGKDRPPRVLDGPFAETKEQFLGFYVVDVEDREAAVRIAEDLAKANPGPGCYEIRPVMLAHNVGMAEGKDHAPLRRAAVEA